MSRCLSQINKKTALALAILATIVLCINATAIRDSQLKKQQQPRYVNENYGFGSLKPPIDSNILKSPTYYFNASVDNFDPKNDKQYQQRYWYNKKWYKKGGLTGRDIVYLFIGGEGAGNAAWVDNEHTLMTLSANETNAYVFMLEHRFYGESQPTDYDFSEPSRLLLSSQQALADIQSFIQSKNKELRFVNPKWITWGCSYPGSLSAWVRQQYPSDVFAAVASSGPVQAVVDFTGYDETIYKVLYQYNPSCAAAAHKGFLRIQELVKTSDGINTLNTRLKLCHPITLNGYMLNFYENIIGNYQDAAQHGYSIPTLCQKQTAITSDDLDGIVNVNDWLLEMHKEDCKFAKHGKSVSENSATVKDVDDGQAWVWQTCNEFGYYQTTDSLTVQQLFTGNLIPVNYWVRGLCEGRFNMANTTVYSNIVKTNNYYHGQNGYQGTKVIFSLGKNDPWHTLGVLKALNDEIYPIQIDGTTHCQDITVAKPSDSSSLVKARSTIRAQVLQWAKA